MVNVFRKDWQWSFQTVPNIICQDAQSPPQGLMTIKTDLFKPVVWNLYRSNGTTPSKANTNSVPDQHSIYPGGQHTFAFYTKWVTPKWEGLRCLQYSRFQSSAFAVRSKRFISPGNAIMYVGDMYAGLNTSKLPTKVETDVRCDLIGESVHYEDHYSNLGFVNFICKSQLAWVCGWVFE